MRKRNTGLVIGLIIAVVMFTLGLLPAQTFAEEKKFVWRYQNAYPAADASNFITSKMWKDEIEKVTNGRITVNLYEPNAIVPPLEMQSAIMRGVLDAGLGPAHGPGLILGGLVAHGYPGQFSNLDDGYRLVHELGLMEIARKAYMERDMYLLCSSAAGSIFFMTNFPIRSVNDLKGKKLHAAGMRAKWMSSLGISVVTLPGTELYMALKLGTVDGITFTGPELESMKLMEVVKYVSLPPLYMVNNLFTLNLKKWNELPDDLKTTLNEWSKKEFKLVGGAALDYQEKSLAAAKKYGVEFIELPEAEVAKMRDKAEESSWIPWSKKDKYFAEGAEITKNYYSRK